MKVGAMFAGYGGIERGLSQVLDVEPAWFAENEAAPSRILAHHWPHVPNLGDVTKVDWTAVEPVDVITGGSPCQDLSHAGKRKGMRPGTRSGLWASMCDAIDLLRPRLVLWENVRGALSAEADSALESCAGCVGDADDGPVLRALGRVLGDLAELGYDAAWTGLRAADVGAPHGRFRVFLIAWPAADSDGDGLESLRWLRPVGRDADGRAGAGQAPALTLLPTPAVNDMGAAYTPDEWDEWTARMKAAHGNGNGHGASLAVEALRISQRGVNGGDPAEAGPREALRDVRGSDEQEAVQRQARGPGSVPTAPLLLPELRQHEADGDERRAALARTEAQSAGVQRVRSHRGSARPPQGPEPGEQRAGQPDDALRLLPPSAALARGPREADGGVSQGASDCGCSVWGQYAPAIHRWEMALGRVAPAPTQPTGRDGTHRLNARAVEFLMGLPDGWVTDVPGVSRNDQLKALGNGVVPQQCAAAVRHLLGVRAFISQEVPA